MLTDTQKLERRNHELLILNSIAEALNRELNINAAVNVVLAKVAELLDLQTGWAWLLEEQSSETYLAAAQNLPPALANYPERLQGSCFCLRTYREGDLAGAANINVVTCSRLEFLMQGTEGLTYHASIPLYSYDRQKKLGVLNVASRDWRELSDEDLRLLHTVGDLLGMAIERALLFEKSRQLGAIEERNRLARDIHDTLAQGLAGIAMQLETLDALLETDTHREKWQGIVRRTLELTRRNLEEARRSVMDLRAAPLDNRTLPEALSALVAEIEGVKVTFEVMDGGRPLSVRLETGLYRIAQEALNNIRQHAHARQVNMKLVMLPEQVQLTIEDDGCGFDPTQVGSEHFGLIGLSERARLLGGTLHIQTDPGSGTRLEVHVPFH